MASETLKPLVRIAGESLPIPPIDLETVTFQYQGKTVPGVALARLLGLAYRPGAPVVELGAANEPPTPDLMQLRQELCDLLMKHKQGGNS